MVKDGKMFKAKNRKHKQDARHLKAAISAMPKPVHPKKGSQVPSKPPIMDTDGSEAESVPVENIFAQKLASNDSTMRNRAVKKLKKWLEARSSSESDPFTEIEMMRLWKGLYYCFWMSDKPLVQEELAESIGSMTVCFGMNSSSAFLFISCFVRTMGREWVGIDRWRMDKFMMLIRRVLRCIFIYLAKFGWDAKLVAEFCDIIEKRVVSVNTINQQTKTQKKKKRIEAENRNEESAIHVFHASLGFQLHFIDIFLEELAKIGGEDLQAEPIHLLIQPFINELAKGEDERLNEHIEERIFNHLMRQSDIGISYEESLEAEDCVITGSDVMPDDDVGEDDDDDEMLVENDAKDPRAGKVDVVLPQLQPDYEKLSNDLFTAGSGKTISKKNCDRLYRLSNQMKDLAAGAYPLAAELSEDELEIPKIDSKKSAKKAAREEFEMLLQVKEEKRKFKEEMRLKQKGLTLVPEQQQEIKMVKNDDDQDESEPLPEKIDVGEQKAKTEIKKLKKESKKKTGFSETEEKVRKAEKRKKAKAESELSKEKTAKKKFRNGDAAPSSPLILSLTPEQKSHIQEQKKKKQELGANGVVPEINKEESAGLVLNISTEKKKSKKVKKKAKEVMEDKEQVVTISNKKRKMAKTPNNKPISSELLTNSLPTKIGGLKKKRINFSLMENKCSSLHEIDKSILDSPDIPFSADRKPKQGVLKKTSQHSSASSTPVSNGHQSVAINTMLNGRSRFTKRRSIASDFF